MKKSLLVLTLLLFGCTKVPPSTLQPGLQFFVEIDEVRFVCARSFHDGIDIIARRPFMRPKASPLLITTIHPAPSKPGDRPTPIVVEKTISEEIFAELRSYVTRQDLIDHSLSESPITTDGSMWSIEGRKGDLVIRHLRRNPLQGPDKAFVAIGKRFMALGDVSIPKRELF